MKKEVPIFKNAAELLGKICYLPYTDDELDCIGRLGFDMHQNKEFALQYMQKLSDQAHKLQVHEKVNFAKLNLRLYREILQQADLEQIPDWIVYGKTPKNANKSTRARIVAMYKNLAEKSLNVPHECKTK